MSSTAYPSNSHFQSLITKLLNTRLRIDSLLDNLVILLSINRTTKQSRIDRQQLYSIIQQQTDIIKIYKLSILVQRITIQGMAPDSQYLIQKLISACKQNVVYKQEYTKQWTKLQNNNSNTNILNVCQFFKDKIVLPYLYYLQKRVYDKNQHIFDYEGMDSYFNIGFNDKLDNKYNSLCVNNNNMQQPIQNITNNNITQQQNRHTNKPTLQTSPLSSSASTSTSEYIHKCIQQSYYLLNLLNKANQLNPSMLAMIRYFGGRYGCIVDYNITMALDLQLIYNRLIKIVKYIHRYTSSIINTKQNIHIHIDNDICIDSNKYRYRQLMYIQQLYAQIQKTNQQLYHVYYNCYYYRYVQACVPKFINTEKYINMIHSYRMNRNRGYGNKNKNRSSILSSNNMNINIDMSNSNSNMMQNSLLLIKQLTNSCHGIGMGTRTKTNKNSNNNSNKLANSTNIKNNSNNNNNNNNNKREWIVYSQNKYPEQLVCQPEQQQQYLSEYNITKSCNINIDIDRTHNKNTNINTNMNKNTNTNMKQSLRSTTYTYTTPNINNSNHNQQDIDMDIDILKQCQDMQSTQSIQSNQQSISDHHQPQDNDENEDKDKIVYQHLQQNISILLQLSQVVDHINNIELQANSKSITGKEDKLENKYILDNIICQSL